MTQPYCERGALIEAMLDGRLGPSEHASSERHLASCASCTELVRDLISLQQRLKASSTPISPLEHQRARLALLRAVASSAAPRRKRAALVAVALLLSPLAAWAAVSKLAPLIVGARSVEKTALPAEAKHGRPARPRSAPTVAAGAAGASAETSPSLAAGSLSSAPEPETSRSLAPQTPAAKSALSPAMRLPPSAAGRPHAPARAVPSAPSPRAEAGAPASISNASADFAEAMRALSRGDFSAGASKLAHFASAYPRDPRVEDAVYLESIALERAGRIVEAKAAARRYLAAYPTGAHQLQARRLTGD